MTKIFPTAVRLLLPTLVALLAIASISVASGAALRAVHSGFSSAVFGMAILLVLLLAMGHVAAPMARASHWLLRWFPLFFVPSCVGAMRYGALLRHSWFGIVLALVLSTMLGIGVAATAGTLVARGSARP